MKAIVLLLGNPAPSPRLRIQNFSKVHNLTVQKISLPLSIDLEIADFYVLFGLGISLTDQLEAGRSIKALIGETPLFFANETSLDPRVRAKIPTSVCDGFIALNELESTIHDMLVCARLTDLADVSGVTINQKRQVVAISPRKPKTHHLPAEHLRANLTDQMDSFGYYPVLNSLGCSERCHHCNILSREGFRRQMSTEELATLAVSLNREQGVRKISFLDQDFNQDHESLRLFSEKLIESNCGIEWKAGFFFREFSETLVTLLKESGLKEAHFVIFSGSDRVLKRNNIKQTVKLIRNTLRQFFSSGIVVRLKVMVGLPYENWVDYHRTLAFLESVRPLVHEVQEIRSISMEANSFYSRRHEEFGIQINPGDYTGWVRQERDHLNDHSSRIMKQAFIEHRLKGMGLFHKKGISEQYDLFEMQKRYDEFKASRKDISLVTCPPWGYLNPPVGIAKLAGYLNSKGRTCAVFDFNVDLYLKYEDFQRLWHVENKSYWSNDLTFDVIRSIYDQDIDEAIDQILDINTDLIGFSAVDPKERMTIEFMQRLRENHSELTIILGGQVCGTKEYRHIFFDKLGPGGVDCYVVGEGEDTLMDILTALDNSQSLKDIPGTCHVDTNGEWTFAPSRPKVDLWNLPITTFEEFDLSKYSCQELLLEWSRGCIGTCSFCKAKVLDGKFRSYSPEHVVESLRYYVGNYGIRKYTICDLAVNGNWKLLEKTCDAIIESGIKVELRAQGIPRRQMKLPLLQKMKAAGFVEMQWGVESGSDKVLKAMDKDWMFTIAEAQEVIRNSHVAQIKTCMFCMVGYPTEEEEDHRMTYDFIDRNAEYLDMVKSVNSLHIITDTPIHHKAQEFGLVLPERDYHYLWSMPGNTHEIRQKRVKELLDLIKIKNLECVETNFLEGRQYEMVKDYREEYVPMDEKIARLRKDINQLIDYRMNQAEQWEGDDNPREEFLANHRDLLGVIHGKQAFVGPKIVEIDLSNNCNFNCVGCWCHCDHLEELKTPAQKRKNFLPLETIQGLIKDLADLGTKTIQLAGPGEPFTHPQIMDIIRYIKGNGLELHIITNFSYIDFPVAQELMDLRVDSLTCSLWAGSEEAFLRTHPNQTAKAFHDIKNILTFFGNNKKYNRYPRIKIYNVINHLNATDIENMVQFGREVRADTMEFTVVDTVPGKTEFLSLTLDDVKIIEEQFSRVSASATYPDPPGHKHLAGLSKEQMEEHYELHAKFFTDMGDYQGFDYEPVNKVMTCKAGVSNERMVHDPEWLCANVFYFPSQGCMSCSQFNECQIDKQDFSIKTRFFAVLGFGSFIRRARASAVERSRKEGRGREVAKLNLLPATPFVDTLPCTIGWSYSRITTSGDVIPCCKGYNKPLGNLYENHFKHIWNDHKMREFRFRAKNISKGDAYFEPIGCYKACDNVGNNMEIHKRLKKLKPRELSWLQEEAKRVDQT